MKIEKGVLQSIDSTDIVNGVLKLPKEVKEIEEHVINQYDDLVNVVALNLKQIGNYNFSYCKALTTINAPVLEQIGNYNFRYCNALTTINAPVLEQIGNNNFYDFNALTALKIGKHKLKVKCIDSIPFVIENQKKSKGFKIYTGFSFKGTDKKQKLIKEHIYVAEKHGFFAHGETVKKAINDVQFKIVSEKIKNNPINEDTEITVMYYRTVTGACDLGCREFMESNGIPYKVQNGETIEEAPVKAKDLLPILEKTEAYGLNRFRKLIQF